MKADKLFQVSQVVAALYEREFRVIGSILAEETRIRGNLTQLEVQIRGNREACANNHHLQAVGGQLLWQAWTTRTHRQLNTELAQIMAKKLMALDRVRVAFGRQRAVELMMSAERHATKDRRAKQSDTYLLRFV